MGVREAVEQAIIASIGAASLTRERVEQVVADLVGRGHLGVEEGRAVIDRIMARARGEGGAAGAVAERVEGGVQAVMRELGVARKADLADIEMRLAAVEHRLRLVEGALPEPPPAPPV